MMNGKNEKNSGYGLNRAIGELLAEIYISAQECRQKINDFFSALPHQQKVLIEVPFLIRLLQRGEKESALTMMLEIPEIEKVTESEAVAIALKGGLIARGPGMLLAYQGANPAIRKLFHVLRKEVR
jgi:hypothetical protein